MAQSILGRNNPMLAALGNWLRMQISKYATDKQYELGTRKQNWAENWLPRKEQAGLELKEELAGNTLDFAKKKFGYEFPMDKANIESQIRNREFDNILAEFIGRGNLGLGQGKLDLGKEALGQKTSQDAWTRAFQESKLNTQEAGLNRRTGRSSIMNLFGDAIMNNPDLWKKILRGFAPKEFEGYEDDPSYDAQVLRYILSDYY